MVTKPLPFPENLLNSDSSSLVTWIPKLRAVSFSAFYSQQQMALWTSLERCFPSSGEDKGKCAQLCLDFIGTLLFLNLSADNECELCANRNKEYCVCNLYGPGHCGTCFHTFLDAQLDYVSQFCCGWIWLCDWGVANGIDLRGSDLCYFQAWLIKISCVFLPY